MTCVRRSSSQMASFAAAHNAMYSASAEKVQCIFVSRANDSTNHLDDVSNTTFTVDFACYPVRIAVSNRKERSIASLAYSFGFSPSKVPQYALNSNPKLPWRLLCALKEPADIERNVWSSDRCIKHQIGSLYMVESELSPQYQNMSVAHTVERIRAYNLAFRSGQVLLSYTGLG